MGTGDSQYEVLAKCGQPAYRDRDVQYLLVAGVRLQRETIWYYDFGANRFIHILHFRDGTLSGISLGGYGYGDAVAGSCHSNQISVGMTDYELLKQCGTPDDRRNMPEVLVPADRAPDGTYVVIDVRRWTYDFGPGGLPLTVTIRKGVVREVQSGSRL